MSIPTSLIVVLLVVAWLVVLVPMVARRREKVPQAEPAGSNFRVLRRASASLRRRPGRGAKGRTVTEMDRQGDSAPETSTEVLVTVGADQRDEPMDAADEWAAAQAAHARRIAPQQAPRRCRSDQSGLADVDDERDDDQVALWSDEHGDDCRRGSVDEARSADEFGRTERRPTTARRCRAAVAIRGRGTGRCGPATTRARRHGDRRRGGRGRMGRARRGRTGRHVRRGR